MTISLQGDPETLQNSISTFSLHLVIFAELARQQVRRKIGWLSHIQALRLSR